MRTSDTESAADARSWLEAGEAFDVAVVDVKAVGGDPAGLGRRAAGGDVPVVALAPIAERCGIAGHRVAGWLTRPVRRSQVREALRTALGGATPGPTAGAAHRAPGLRVLVAEDNPVNQRVIGLFLEKLGHAADVVADGRAAVRAVQDRLYDVVLMDMQMPELDGLRATRLIHERWPQRRPRIIAVTANAVAGDRELCLAAGMDDYLAKPFSMDELAHALAGARPEADATVGP